MNKWLIVLFALSAFLLFGNFVSCNSSPQEMSINISLDTPSITIEEANDMLGRAIPSLKYLPPNYKIQDIFVDDGTVRLMVSDEPVEKVLTRENGSDEYYTIQCKVIVSVRWFDEGKAPPIRLPLEKVDINGNTGFFVERDGYNILWWNLKPDSEQKGFFEITLSALNSISKKEIIKIARSISP